MTVMKDKNEWRVCRIGYERKFDTIKSLEEQGFEVVDEYDVKNTHSHEELMIFARRPDRERAVA